MEIELIGEFEITYDAQTQDLVFHHVIRGFDVAQFQGDAITELRDLLQISQKRIRNLANYQLLLGAGGDMTIYTNTGQRACYLNADQTALLARILRRELA